MKKYALYSGVNKLRNSAKFVSNLRLSMFMSITSYTMNKQNILNVNPT